MGVNNVYSYNIMINGLWKGRTIDEAMNLFQEICMWNVVLDIVTYHILLLMVYANLGESLIFWLWLKRCMIEINNQI